MTSNDNRSACIIVYLCLQAQADARGVPPTVDVVSLLLGTLSASDDAAVLGLARSAAAAKCPVTFALATEKLRQLALDRETMAWRAAVTGKGYWVTERGKPKRLGCTQDLSRHHTLCCSMRVSHITHRDGSGASARPTSCCCF